MKVAVTSATQSPANPRRWFLETSCGHGAWVTSRSKPTRKFVQCHICDLPQERRYAR